jgi:hypothetical protein
MAGRAGLFSLPMDVWGLLMEYTPPRSHVSLRAVCRVMRDIIDQDTAYVLSNTPEAAHRPTRLVLFPTSLVDLKAMTRRWGHVGVKDLVVVPGRSSATFRGGLVRAMGPCMRRSLKRFVLRLCGTDVTSCAVNRLFRRLAKFPLTNLMLDFEHVRLTMQCILRLSEVIRQLCDTLRHLELEQGRPPSSWARYWTAISAIHSRWARQASPR